MPHTVPCICIHPLWFHLQLVHVFISLAHLDPDNFAHSQALSDLMENVVSEQFPNLALFIQLLFQTKFWIVLTLWQCVWGFVLLECILLQSGIFFSP